MITVRRSSERGHVDFGWLNTRHSFSFGSYHDPRHMGFRVLRVINDDLVAPDSGFPMHPHRDMEIVSYIVEGTIAHKDSMGHEAVIRAGEIQRMSAGTGITHSEFNPSSEETLRLLQVWLLPEGENITPEYDQKSFPRETKLNRLCLLVSGDGREGSSRMHQDADMYASVLEAGRELTFELDAGRHAWVQVVDGELAVNDQRLETGDGAAVSNETVLRFKADSDAEFLLFDLA